MFRKIAFALAAATMLAAPVMAQTAPAPDKAPAATPAATPAPAKTIKAEKATTKHRKYARAGHGAPSVKHVKQAKYAHHLNRGKHPQTHGTNAAAKPATIEKSAKRVASKQVSTKPATRSGVN